MQKLFVTLLIAVATASAIAAPADSGMAAPPRPIFEIDRNDMTAHAPQQTVMLYSSGAWTFTETVDAKTTNTRSGTLGDDPLKQARADLTAAKWTQTPVIHCMARTSKSTTYKVDGKSVFTAMMCNSSKLDDASAKSLTDLEQLLASAWTKPAAQ